MLRASGFRVKGLACKHDCIKGYIEVFVVVVVVVVFCGCRIVPSVLQHRFACWDSVIGQFR